MVHSNDKCRYYSVCKLRENNNAYLLQAVYLFLAVCVFLFDITQLTFFSFLLCIIPIIIDLWYNDSVNKVLNICFKIFFTVNSIIAVLCLIGLSGNILDKGTYFELGKHAAIFCGLKIDKAKCAEFMIIEIAVPLMFYAGCPCKKNMKAQIGVKSALAQSKE